MKNKLKSLAMNFFNSALCIPHSAFRILDSALRTPNSAF
jgi:hypothetical protein